MVIHFFLGYLDPGAGSMFLQIILAGVLGLSYAMKTYWRRITRFLRRGKDSEKTMAELPPTEDNR